MDIGQKISKAIKEGKWLSVNYQNKENKETHFWCSIIDINIENEYFIVNEFNESKISENSDGLIFNAKLFYKQIKSAKVLERTSYDAPEGLIEKIEANEKSLKWLQFDLFNEDILNYLKDCILYDNPPYQNKKALIPAVDEIQLQKSIEKGYYKLNYKQIHDFTAIIDEKHIKKNMQYEENRDFVLNLLAINVKELGLFVVAYKNVTFDPSKMSLIIQDEVLFNYDFLVKLNPNIKHSLRSYLDIETEDFVELFSKNREEAKNMLAEALPKNKEELDDRPYIMELVRHYIYGIQKDYEQIVKHKLANELSIPIQTFFGNMDKRNKASKRDFDIVLLDENVDMPQLRLIYNGLKNKITYVQGPPGSGKTQTILNLVISSFFNGKTSLITSNNNKPINDIIDKFATIMSKGKTIPLPIIRLGNNKELANTIENIRKRYKEYSHYLADEEKLNKHRVSNVNDVKDINDIIDKYEEKLELEERIDALQSLYNHLDETINGQILIEHDLAKLREKYDSLKVADEDTVMREVFRADHSFFTWLFFTSIKFLKKLNEPKNKRLFEIFHMENLEDAAVQLNNHLAIDANFNAFLKVFPIVLTTNRSAPKLGNANPYFDLVIIDEAGQCELGYSLSAIARGKQLLLLGDQKQLNPVITLDPKLNNSLIKKHHVSDTYNYCENSIIKLMQNVDRISMFILLSHHYRCHKDIINFSNLKYYDNQLVIKDKENKKEENPLSCIDVRQNEIARLNSRNTSIAEVEAILEDIKKNKYTDIGIITPFKNQAELLATNIPPDLKDKITCGTIHQFQGDQKEVIYFSAAINKYTNNKAFDWAKDNEELLNVATTRAKNRFIFVGDFNEIKKRSELKNDLNDLLTYVTSKGEKIELKESKHKYTNNANYKQYNSKKESELLETLNHVLSFGSTHEIKHHLKVNSVLSKFTSPEDKDFGAKSEFDFVVFRKLGPNDSKPVLVIELDGDEHKKDKRVAARDFRKERICRDNNIELIRITNDYTRRYIFIKKEIEEYITKLQ